MTAGRGNVVTPPHGVGQSWGPKEAAPRERGDLERAGLMDFWARIQTQ